ncbi:hypothetical protein Maq22A_c18090 [Methylobacterium aquaticum]|uniref:Uncharacterized protein n=1 Tax=Methylobacterium aquaticum TaxID=270351 RepID=A0A0C6FI47_9HYPH|nr:hypothetical protein Maq22A_c18090 [Methylobacterium aquaticum]
MGVRLRARGGGPRRDRAGQRQRRRRRGRRRLAGAGRSRGRTARCRPAFLFVCAMQPKPLRKTYRASWQCVSRAKSLVYTSNTSGILTIKIGKL